MEETTYLKEVALTVCLCFFQKEKMTNNEKIMIGRMLICFGKREKKPGNGRKNATRKTKKATTKDIKLLCFVNVVSHYVYRTMIKAKI